jgi:hypothetical protein
MRRKNAVVPSIGNVFQRACLAYESLTITQPKAVRFPERLRSIITVINAPKNTVDRQRSKRKYFAWASDFKRSTPPQMFSILLRAGKISDPKTTKVSGKSWAENCFGGRPYSSDHDTSPSQGKGGTEAKTEVSFSTSRTILYTCLALLGDA